MLSSRLKNIQQILKKFTGANGEPKDEEERYALKAMWVMLCAEFEGSVKNLVENYINSVKKKKVKDIHSCFLLQNTYGNKEKITGLSKKMIFNLFKIKKVDIKTSNFISHKKPVYKSEPVETLFNSLGIFFNKTQITTLKLLDGIASTRDSISHGDTSISITRKQLESNIPLIIKIYNILKRKLK